MKIVLVVAFISMAGAVMAQGNSGLDSAIRSMTAEEEPEKSVVRLHQIVSKYGIKDSETLDVLYGTLAVNFALHRNYGQFEKYIDSISNKFNQTSFLNMAASKMLEKKVDAVYANKISQKTLALFESYRHDSTARPKDFSREDWNRFMNFAQYPYYDTHAESLFALKKYEEALRYQKMAFKSDPGDGLPASVERYVKLLELTGKKEAAKQLLLKLAGRGKLNAGMTKQLRGLYGGDKLDLFLDSLQKNVQAALARELKAKMLNEQAPQFSLKDISGNIVKLSDYAGKIVVLDLWATWCQPCIASFPAMQVMVKKHPGVVFLFIAVEEKEKDRLLRVKSFLEKNKYSFTVLLDEPVRPGSSEYTIISSYKPGGIPAKYVIDKKGMLQFKTSGFDTDAELINELEAMFLVLDR